jgi:hypothetical protein
MRRIGFVLTVLVVITMLFTAQARAAAAFTVASQILDDYGDVKVLTVTLSVAVSGSVALDATHMTKLRGLYLYSVETDPGTLTADYDIVISDANGLNVCAGNTTDRHTTTTQSVYCTTSTQPYSVVRNSVWTLTVSNQTENSTLTLIMTFAK